MTIYVPGKVTLTKEFTVQDYMWNFPQQYGLWSPAEITTALWLDAADASTVITESGAVSQWNDKSGNNQNASQSTAGDRPVFSSTGLNNRHSINFDGDGDNLVLPTGFLNGSTAISVAFVMSGPLQQNDAIFGPATTNSVGLELLYTNVIGFPTLVRINNVNKITTGLWSTNSQPTISTLQADASATAGWLNGATVSAVSTTGIAALNFNGFYSVGTYSNNDTFGASGATVSANMNLSEFIVSTSTWSTIDRQRIEGYLAHKWGLTANLPNDHPYKLVGPTP